MKSTAKAQTTRDAILDATARLLGKYGYKKMTIDDLAQEVGIGKGSIYLHFNSKEEIALSHIDRIVDQIKFGLRSIAAESTSTDDRLVRMMLHRVIVRFESVQNYSQSLNELLSYLRPRLLERRKRYFDEEAKILATVVLEGQADGTYLAGDPNDIGQTLITATNSLLPYSLSAFELGDQRELKDRATKVAMTLVNGIKTQSGSGR